MILCITGMPNSGKSTAASILSKKGFKIVEMRSFIEKEMKKEHIKVDPLSIRDFSTKIRERMGQDAVAQLAIKHIKAMKGNIIISGIRSVYEINYFKSKIKNDFYVIAITAPARIRYKRAIAVEKPDATKTYSEFIKRDKIEKSWGLADAIDNADFIISNTSTQKALESSLSKVLDIINSTHANAK
ncbi:MAG: AAA family ATPase [Candidatus Micrarchaeia archaeon]